MPLKEIPLYSHGVFESSYVTMSDGGALRVLVTFLESLVLVYKSETPYIITCKYFWTKALLELLGASSGDYWFILQASI